MECWGELACFTRPELKVERVSYPVMTPSAADGLLRAIFGKPEFRYVVRKIEVLAPIRWLRMQRNEVQSVVGAQRIKQLQTTPEQARYDVELDRDQRSTVALRDVHYRIHTQVELTPRGRNGNLNHPPASEPKFRDQLRRRVERGACFSQPFFGCREFTAFFGPSGPAHDGRLQTQLNEPLGVMLHSIEYGETEERYRWFQAELQQGVLEVKEPLPDEAVAMPTSAPRARGGRG